MKKLCNKQELLKGFYQSLYTAVEQGTRQSVNASLEEEELKVLLPPPGATPLLF